MINPQSQVLATISVTTVVGAVVGFGIGDAATALLAGCAGFLLGWAICKRAVAAGLRGALLGAAFAVLVGPGADHFVNGVPFSEKLKSAVIVGSLVGGLLGVRNFREPRDPAANTVEASSVKQ